MQVKVLNPQYARRNLYGGNVQQYHYYEGEIVATPKWVEYEALCLSTGDKRFPFRIISKSDIVEVNGKQNIYVEKPKVKQVTIKGSKGDQYVVSLDGSRSTCTCSGFQFRRSCRHIMEAQRV